MGRCILLSLRGSHSPEGQSSVLRSALFLEPPPPGAVLEQRWALIYLCGRARLDPFTLLLCEGPREPASSLSQVDLAYLDPRFRGIAGE